MLKVNNKQHIRFIRLEQPTVWVVLAILLETRGDETVAISEPKVVKIIPKTVRMLAGTVGSSVLALGTSACQAPACRAVASPYIGAIFGTVNSRVIIGLAPMPPTDHN